MTDIQIVNQALTSGDRQEQFKFWHECFRFQERRHAQGARLTFGQMLAGANAIFAGRAREFVAEFGAWPWE